MLLSDMNLKIRSETAGYNDEILMFDSGFSLGKDDMVNTSAQKKSSHKTPIILKHSHETPIIPKHSHKEVLPLPKHTSAIMHKEEKIALVLILAGAFRIWYALQ